MKNIIFDYDGVIYDSLEFHVRKYNELYNIGLIADDLRTAHEGNFYQAKINKFEGIDFTSYAESVTKEQGLLPFYANAKKIILKLSEKFDLYIVSSAYRLQIEPHLKNNNVEGVFKRILAREDAETKHDNFLKLVREENIRIKDSIFVTDTLGDLLEANKIQLSTIAVTFGFHDQKLLQRGNPDHIAHSWEEIENILF